jgi:hypothetical protein
MNNPFPALNLTCIELSGKGSVELTTAPSPDKLLTLKNSTNAYYDLYHLIPLSFSLTSLAFLTFSLP